MALTSGLTPRTAELNSLRQTGRNYRDPDAHAVCSKLTCRHVQYAAISGLSERMKKHAFEMKGLRRILRVSWTAKKTNGWVLNKAVVKRELLDTVKARKLAYYGHSMRKQLQDS